MHLRYMYWYIYCIYTSLRKEINFFRHNNGYSRKFVKVVIRRTLHNTQLNDDDDQKYIYLKLPFVNEEFKRRFSCVIRRSGINNIKIHFMNGRPSSRVFAPLREKPNCPMIVRPAN